MMPMQSVLSLPAKLECMMLIRAYEEKLAELHVSTGLAGTCTSVGQEASAVGVVKALTGDDRILTNVSELAFTSLKAPVARIAGPDVPAPSSYVLEQAFMPQADVIVKKAQVLMQSYGARTNHHLGLDAILTKT